jgi:hypothetical protein
MVHQAHVFAKPDGGQNPWHVECSCGTAGDFPNEAYARSWMQAHFNRLSGIDTVAKESIIAGDQKKLAAEKLAADRKAAAAKSAAPSTSAPATATGLKAPPAPPPPPNPTRKPAEKAGK